MMKTKTYSILLALSFCLLPQMILAQVTPEGKIVITQPCEICDDVEGMDEDGDGHANCDDLECILEDFSNVKNGTIQKADGCADYDSEVANFGQRDGRDAMHVPGYRYD